MAIEDVLLVDGLVVWMVLLEHLDVFAIPARHGLRVGLLDIGTLVVNVYSIGGLGNRGLKTLVADMPHILPLADLVAICRAVLVKAVRCVPGTNRGVSILRAQASFGRTNAWTARAWLGARRRACPTA